MIIAGHRRYYAHLVLNKTKINSIVKKEIDDSELYTLALIENIQRQDLNAIELATSFKNALINNIYQNQEELAKKIGLHKSKITKYLKSLELPEVIVEDIKSKNTIKDIEFLYNLNRLKNSDEQFMIYDNVVNGKTTAKEATKEIMSKINNSLKQKKISQENINKQKKNLFEILKQILPYLSDEEKNDIEKIIKIE